MLCKYPTFSASPDEVEGDIVGAAGMVASLPPPPLPLPLPLPRPPPILFSNIVSGAEEEEEEEEEEEDEEEEELSSSSSSFSFRRASNAFASNAFLFCSAAYSPANCRCEAVLKRRGVFPVAISPFERKEMRPRFENNNGFVIGYSLNAWINLFFKTSILENAVIDRNRTPSICGNLRRLFQARLSLPLL